jgi:hypothetical protein
VEWHSLHVVYYEENKDALVLGGVRPLFRILAPRVAAVSYIRHWRLGPHLRLNVCCDADTMAATVRPLAEQVVGGFLGRQPSRARLVPEEHLAAHRRLAEVEQEAGPLVPWRPDNTLHEAPFDRRVPVLGSEAAADLLADFYADSTELAFRMTEDVVAGRQRLALAFDLMVVTAHALSGLGIAEGFLSFRSHADAFLAGFPEARGLRPAWDEHYCRHRASLRDRVELIVASLDDGSATIPHAEEWTALMRPYRQRGHQLVARGQLSMLEDQRGPDLKQVSRFHREAHPAWAAVLKSDWFVLYRLMLNYTYLHLTRLGVTPVERFLLCHLAANAVEDSYGVAALDKVRQPPPAPAGLAGELR